MILTVSPVKALVFIVFLIILQQFEGNVIYPRVVGSSMGLPGIWVLAAVTVGGGVMGVAGMLIGVPLAATVYRLVARDVRRWEKEQAAIKETPRNEPIEEQTEAPAQKPAPAPEKAKKQKKGKRK
jgi:predicted PurR-regulated permease PerM